MFYVRNSKENYSTIPSFDYIYINASIIYNHYSVHHCLFLIILIKVCYHNCYLLCFSNCHATRKSLWEETQQKWFFTIATNWFGAHLYQLASQSNCKNKVCCIEFAPIAFRCCCKFMLNTF